MYAVFDDETNSIIFVGEIPEGYGGSYQENVSIDPASDEDDLSLWPHGALAPKNVLCVSTSNPHRYRVFKYPEHVDRREYTPTERNFGGVFAQLPQWLTTRERGKAQGTDRQ